MEIITAKKAMRDIEADLLQSKYIDESYFDRLINFNCDVIGVNGNVLAKFRRGVVPLETLKLGVDSFSGSIVGSHNRGYSAGGYYHKEKKYGTLSKALMSKTVESGIVGSIEAGGLTPYCRMTSFTADYFETFQKGIPFVKKISDLYAELAPDKYKIQKEYAKATNQNYVIKDTAFSTVTVNKNFRTAVHKDVGDLEKGLGNLIAYRQGKWTGGYFCLPQYRIAFDLQNTDALFVDVHQWHANTPFYNDAQAEEEGIEMTDWGTDNLRISFVLYYREELIKCPSPINELKRLKNNFKFENL